MQRAISVVRKAAVKQDRVVETLTLDHHGRNARHAALKGDGGQEIVLDLDKPTALNDGDAVKLEDGSLVLIKAASQKLIAITAENPLRLTRLAWHLGGHHVAAEVTADAIYVEHDPALAELVRGQGCAMSEVERPFQPEPEVHHHEHGDACGHDHGHSHAGHDHDHGHEHHHTHEHGASCGCGHDHHHHDDHGHKHDHGHHGHEHGHKGHKHDH
ncbi:Urease accessory protein UreE [Bosea sp. 62]|uniref:urease accessory protein UreE n=1 Tax=unclassified Bosea (in: a-proteobacteria) TaxID=2653178 RepID=UPI001259B870|nr:MULTISPECIES: urease accessory protein UreE [unclassified Bosea (in: a-proteobacteria)]CAD5289515.1 Urease accessory protein UreE [Bosea sp. 7B]CAD5300271.1 Urease accessory protein UreE [Bosea sp. 21B]CAD5300789.1 Urease accessory protein UreE [Bosea sp. 46]VVT61972.1 Urease accessory protein UreE [Bosea sp. EC-HK365B]VXB48202.1 Urease accessory protein UreE [Bosea sp. 125]